MTNCARCSHGRDEHKLVFVQDDVGPMGRRTDHMKWPERLHCRRPFCICRQFVWPRVEREVLTNA